MRVSTRLVTGPQPQSSDDSASPSRGSAPKIERSTTFVLDAAGDEALHRREGVDARDVYGRFGTQTVRDAARLVAEVEGGNAGVLFSSGMAAIAAAFGALVPRSGRVAVSQAVYGGTQDLLVHDLPERGVEVLRFEPTDPESLEAALARDVDLVWFESLDNPLVRPAPVAELAARCRRAKVPVAVDATFTGGMAVRPLELGVDLVVHSATKFLNGHSDVIAGVAVGDTALVRRLYALMTRHGSCLDPHAAWLLMRGLRTLPLRFAAQTESARSLAIWLEGDPRVGAVHYAGLHTQLPPGFQNGGAVLSFDLGTMARAQAFCFGVDLALHATSLGGIETLVSSPARSSHATVSAEDRALAGIGDGLVRVAVGLEDVRDLRADFDAALSKVGLSSKLP